MQETDVESITFKFAEDESAIIYEEIDENNYDSESDTYSLDFHEGDTITATLTNGKEKTLIYSLDEENGAYWLIKGENKRLKPSYNYVDSEGYEDERWQNPDFSIEEDEEGNPIPWKVGRNNKVRVQFGVRTERDGEDVWEPVYSDWINIELRKNPVENLTFTQSDNSDEDRFFNYEGEHHNFWGLISGDKIDVTIDGTQKTFVFDDYRYGFYCGNEALPERYGSWDIDIEYGEDSESWEAGSKHTIYFNYAGKRWPISEVETIASPVESIEITKDKTTYSLATLLQAEDENEDYARDSEGNYLYNDYDPETGEGIGDPKLETTYRYEIYDYDIGDKIKINWKEGGSTTYTYKEHYYQENGETVESLDFVDDNNNVLYFDTLSTGFINEKMTVSKSEGSKVYPFKLTYKGKTATVNITVTYSSDEEIEVEKHRQEARDRIYDLNEKHQIYEKIEQGKYRDAQVDVLYAAMDKVESTIEKATSKSQIDAAIAEYEKVLKNTKTDAQLKSEEAAAAKKASEKAAAAKKAADEAKEWNGTVSNKIPAAKAVKAKAGKKSIKASWKKANKKNLKNFDKVEIQVCPNKKFQKKDTKRIMVSKSKKTATVKKLKKGKTYYVRVRNVKGSGTKKTVSKWSKVKKVKVK